MFGMADYEYGAQPTLMAAPSGDSIGTDNPAELVGELKAAALPHTVAGLADDPTFWLVAVLGAGIYLITR